MLLAAGRGVLVAVLSLLGTAVGALFSTGALFGTAVGARVGGGNGAGAAAGVHAASDASASTDMVNRNRIFMGVSFSLKWYRCRDEPPGFEP